MSIDYHELIPLPPLSDINTGLSAARQSTMLGLLGRPGDMTQDCSPITNVHLRTQIVTENVGPFRVEGWKPAVDRLKLVFAAVKTHDPALYAVVGTAGMLCCRAVRGSRSNYSNHSWGTAIDLKIGDQLDPLGATHCQRGILLLYPFMHAHGFFWAAGYRGRKDPMHMELADETIHSIVQALAQPIPSSLRGAS